MICGNCKANVPGDSKFCPICGARVQGSQNPPQAGFTPLSNPTAPSAQARRFIPTPIIIAGVVVLAVLSGLVIRMLRNPKEKPVPAAEPPAASVMADEEEPSAPVLQEKPLQSKPAHAEETLKPAPSLLPEETEPPVEEPLADALELHELPEPPKDPSPVLKIDPNGLDNYMNGAAPESLWAFAVMDISDGELVGSSRMSDSLSSSALLNIPILYTCAALSDRGVISLETTIRISSATPGRTALADRVGENLSVRELLSYMLQYSDNTASNTLMDNLTFRTVNETCASHGYTSVSVNNFILSTTDYTSNDNYVSCSDLCGMLQELYSDRFSTLGSAFLQQNMVIRDSAAASGLGQTVPSNLMFMNLNGQKADKYNEVAIVDDGTHSYIIAFMGCKSTMEKMTAAAATCGKYVYGVLDLQ